MKKANVKISENDTKKDTNLKKINYFGKFILSGILAVIVLSFGMYFYFNIPIHDESYDNVVNKITNYKYEPIEIYTRGTEGYGKGRINNDGYVNIHDYSKDMPIDILIMGSSQIEAFQVNIDESITTLLEKNLKNKVVYNVGISGHVFLQNVSKIKNAIDKYHPKDYIILETDNINFSTEELNSIINNEEFENNVSENEGIMSKIRKNKIFRTIYRYSPFLKLVFQQIQEFNKMNNEDDLIDSNIKNDIYFNEYLTKQLLVKIKNDVSNSNSEAKLIIMYHPSTTLKEDGSLILSSEIENVEEFSSLCKENGIYFLDMSDRFREEYEKNYVLPYGFSNTSVGNGHLNKYGHKMIADQQCKQFF